MKTRASRADVIVLVDVATDLSTAPTEFRLLPYGEVRTKKGAFTNDERAMNEVISAFESHGIDMVFDYEHQTLSGEQAPAAGWITKLVNRGKDGLWAIVNWTERARQYLAAREYRYFSPVFRAVKDTGRIVELHSAGLTNKPAMLDIEPLVMKALEALGGEPGAAQTSSPQGEHAMKQIIELLKLKSDAVEADVVAALKTLMEQAGAATTVVAAKAVLEALDLKEDANQSTAVATIHALKQTAQTAASASEVQALKDRLARRDADDLVSAAMKAGKITPAQKDWADQYALKDPAGFEVFVDKSPVVVPFKNADGGNGEKKGGAGLDETQLAINKMLGVSEETFKKYRGGKATA